MAAVMTLAQRLARLAEKTDGLLGWYRLPKPLGLAVLVGLRRRLMTYNLFDTGRGPDDRPSANLIAADDADFKTARTLAGTHNDLRDPLMGSIGSRFGRNVKPELTNPETGERFWEPNPRLVSRQLLTRAEFQPATTLNLLAAAWIQFEVHDWFGHDTFRGEDPFVIPLEPDDPWTHDRPMTIRRTARDEPGPPPTFATTDTHWWDGSQIYGNTPGFADGLREHSGGRLKLDKTGLHDEKLEDFLEPLGNKNNFWVGLAILHSLFLREHNVICERLAAEYPAMTDQQLYDTARLINAALIAKIHTLEWTPAVIAHPTTQTAMYANWYGLLGEQFGAAYGRITANIELQGIPGSPTDFHGIPYSLTEEFVAVYRMHPLIPDDYEFRSLRDDNVTHYQLPQLTYRHVRERLREIPMADLFYSFGTAHPGTISLHNYPKHLQDFDRRPRDTPIDLAAADILRTRERGVPRYNAFRRALRLKPAASFEELTGDPLVAEELRQVYGDVERVDLMIGLFAEPKPPGFAFSDTAFRIFILMASRRIESDRFFTRDFRPEVYTELGMTWIRDNSLRTLLLRHFPELEPVLRDVQHPFAPWPLVSPPALVARPAPAGAPRADQYAPSRYLLYSERLEQPAPDEDSDIAEIVRKLHRANERVYRKYGHALRDAHAKSHAILRGELTINDNLPPELSQGLFAKPATYPVIARVSSTSGVLRSDQVRGVHGLAIKVLGVPDGERCLVDDTSDTQDFLLVTHKEFPFKDVKEYRGKGMFAAGLLVRLSDCQLSLLIWLLRIAKPVLGLVGRSLPLPLQVFITANDNMLGMEFYSAAPIRWGDYVAKFEVVPLSENVKRFARQPLSQTAGPEAYREMMVDFFSTGEAEYELRVQLCTDLGTMPIEDATVEWPESQSKYLPVATLRYGKQNPYTDARKYFGDEVLSFNSWRGLNAHRPLGPINRMKLRAYDASSQFRHQKNHARSLEPKVADLPD
jgi:Animal haem peroxidase